MKDDSLDLSDLLGTINLSEEAIYEEAFAKGFEDGQSEGRKEGWTVGVSQGVNIGVELGESRGFSEELFNSITTGRLKLKAAAVQDEIRAKKLCDEIMAFVDKFPTTNVNEEDLMRLLEYIRAKDYVLQAILAKNSAKPGINKAVKDDGQKYSL